MINIDRLLQVQDLMQALKVNVESMPQQETLTEVDMSSIKPPIEGLMNKSLEDLDFPKESLARLQDLFQHDNSDVWDAYVSKMANEAGDTGASVRDLDATIRELADKPDGSTQSLDDYVAKLGNEQPVPGGLAGALGTQLLKESGAVMGEMLNSVQESFDQKSEVRESLNDAGELLETHIKEAIDHIEAAADSLSSVPATSDNTLADLNHDIREHFDLPDHGGNDLEVALADPGSAIEIVEAEVAADEPGEVLEAEADSDYYDDTQEDTYTDATA